MDWIASIEEKKRQEVEAEMQKSERERAGLQGRQKFFQPIIGALQPIIEDRVRQVATRLGIQLAAFVGTTEITVAAPMPMSAIKYQSKHPFWFQISGSKSSIRVRAVIDERIDRPGDPPDDMTTAEFYGVEKEIIDVRTTTDELLAGDLDRLMEWLVASYDTNGCAAAPTLMAVVRETHEKHSREKASLGRSRAAVGSLIAGIVSLWIPIIGLAAFLGGIFTFLELRRNAETTGRKAAIWAIYLGAFALLRAALLLIAFFKS
jgi:hypothetical protein